MNKQKSPPVVVAKTNAIIDKFLNYIDLNEEFDEDGNLLIHLACRSNNISLVEKLIQLNVDLNVVNTYAMNPLKIAVTEGNVHIVNILLRAGVSVGEKNEDSPVLFLAAEKGNLILIKILIELGELIRFIVCNYLYIGQHLFNVSCTGKVILTSMMSTLYFYL